MNKRNISIQKQEGAALIVVIILLLIVTLLGLASMRGAIMQEKMSSALYDRRLGFECAESALRNAEAYLRTAADAGDIGQRCAPPTICQVVPAGTFDAAGTVCSSGTKQNCWTTVAGRSALDADETAGRRPQYFIQFLGLRNTVKSGTTSANCAQYGGRCESSASAWFYRVTARSSAPSSSNRAVVVLQSTVARQ